MPTETQNESEQIDFPDGEVERHLFIMKQIELDNLRDIEDPFVCLNTDNRVNKINKAPLIHTPEEKLRNQNFDFQDSNFWFLKGYDNSILYEMDSAIDSYR